MMSGSVVRAVEQRTSKNGKPYTSCTLHVSDSFPSYWKCIAWEVGVRELMLHLRAGDSISVQGSMKILESDDERRDMMLVNVEQLLHMKVVAAPTTAKKGHYIDIKPSRKSRRRGGSKAKARPPVKDTIYNGNRVTGGAYVQSSDNSCPF
jgi:hypothetical protein